MMTDPTMNSGKPRQQLSPREKYELWMSVLAGQCTQREAADRWRADRSAVVHVCRTPKQSALDALAASVPAGDVGYNHLQNCVTRRGERGPGRGHACGT